MRFQILMSHAMFRLIITGAALAIAGADVPHILRSQESGKLLSPFGDSPPFGSNPGPAIKVDYPGQGNQIPILRSEQNVDPDGSYSWLYETANGIIAQEQGALRVQQQQEPSLAAQGYFAYTSPEGQSISLSYIADENGFQPQGDHLPTPPPIPPAIQRALEWIAAHPEPGNAGNRY